jgi:hypothetical protein
MTCIDHNTKTLFGSEAHVSMLKHYVAAVH